MSNHERHSVSHEFARDFAKYVAESKVVKDEFYISANRVLTSESWNLNKRLGLDSTNKYSDTYTGQLYTEEFCDYSILNEPFEEPLNPLLELPRIFTDVDNTEYSTEDIDVLKNIGLAIPYEEDVELELILNRIKSIRYLEQEQKEEYEKNKRIKEEKIAKEQEKAFWVDLRIQEEKAIKSEARRRRKEEIYLEKVESFRIDKGASDSIELNSIFSYKCSCGENHDLSIISKSIINKKMIAHGCSSCGAKNIAYIK
jgi:hypothetical protein